MSEQTRHEGAPGGGGASQGRPSADALLGAAEIRALAAELDLTPTKRWGQNFVVDANTVRRIVRTADVAGLDVVEVGPGLGSLTLGLTEAGARVTAVEIDPRLAELLPRTVARKQPDAQLAVVHHDALTIESLPVAPQAVVANLPYNVSVPVLIHLLERFPTIERVLVMVQAEVGHRLARSPARRPTARPRRRSRGGDRGRSRATSRGRSSGRCRASTACSSASGAGPRSGRRRSAAAPSP